VEAKRLNRLRAEACLRPTVETPGEAARLEELVLQQGKDIIVIGRDTCSGEPQVHEDWVHFAEQVPSLLIKALPYVSNKEGMECVEYGITHTNDCYFLLFFNDVGWFSNLWRTSLFTDRRRGSLGYTGDYVEVPPHLHVPSDSHQADIDIK
jgi:hypothetical protein